MNSNPAAGIGTQLILWYTRSSKVKRATSWRMALGGTGQAELESERMMGKDFSQIEWDERVEDDCRQIIRLAVREDLDRQYDWTSMALAGADACGRAAVVARGDGVLAGVRAGALVLDEMEIDACWEPLVQDGGAIVAGQTLVAFEGRIRDMLAAERLLLNMIGRLSGIASWTARYVSAMGGAGARLYDTRKTTPGWRRLEKYAVRCGGGMNHRTGLFDAMLIKDNHLALAGLVPGEAVRRARDFLAQLEWDGVRPDLIVEVEVDTLEQLDDVLSAEPDIVLLDNMTLEQLRRAVALRDASRAGVQLEASGGITLETIRAIAETGVERISVGALTHSATALDVGLDWTHF